MRRVLAWAVCAVLVAAPVSPASAQSTGAAGGSGGKTTSTQVRFWPAAERTRLVLESSAPLPYTFGKLSAPDRFYIDITGTQVQPQHINATATQEMPVYLKGLRAGQFDPRTLRVVFDLAEAVNYRIERLNPIGKYRYRLVVDITPQAPPDLLGELLQQLESADAAAQQAPTASTTTPADSKPFIVLIDPGHGGEDPGAVSPNNRYEKDVVLPISRRLQEEINRRPGMRALLTRNYDRFIPLRERVAMVDRLRAEGKDVGAFVSVHADSVRKRSVRGSSVYILSPKGASSKFARELAQRANMSDLIAGEAHSHSHSHAIDPAMRYLVQDGKDRASRQLAEMMLKNLAHINQLRSKRVHSAGFAVLKHPAIPSVLVETAFISNPVEEKKLLSAGFQQQVAKALADALDEYRKLAVE